MPTFDAELWRHDADPPWCFITLPVDLSDHISDQTAGSRGGFGSVRVSETTWGTSIFPDTKRGATC